MLCRDLTRPQANALYLEALGAGDETALRRLAKEDLFFLLTIGCKRKDMDNDWLYARCREVEASPDGHLDLWAREHYKSSIITFGKSIQDILNDPNITIGIFSHTRNIAKDFLKQIKTELERNSFLKRLFPDVLYEDPDKESPRWSIDSGIRVKRTNNPREETVEAWGIVDSQPIGKHFRILIYDDVVTRESVATTDQINKTTGAWELSLSLGAQGGAKRYIGTRYHKNDTYRTIIERGSAIKRVHPAREGGKIDGRPVFMSEELLQEKRRDMGPYTFSSQMLQDPVADKAMGFKEGWLSYYEKEPDRKGWNTFIVVDPASKRKKTSDYTVMLVIALGTDNNYYLIDGIRDRLNLSQRAKKLFELHRQYQPKGVGYEEYGMQSDVEHLSYVMEDENYRFNITRLGGSLAKDDRIQKLVPIFEQHRFWLPKELYFTDYEQNRVDLVNKFVEDEFKAFPVSVHDDMLDCMARILDPVLGAEFPKIQKPKPKTHSVGGGSSWMS